ncbi:unnamed protein product [Phytophthora fragariaefolia]|uniref:Unnamed protein product n=1 Tax=Phytophthora fragariaefolia TaxID=1490495 RepID=A0A9W6YQN6_9STRA|nr:unnamed protein product [Phytophthora fragariaefolia]
MLTKLTIQEALCSNRVFNVDEVAFETRKRSKTAVAIRESKNVWTIDSSTNFHLTIVACGSASGFAVPPVFIVPGKTVRLDVLDTCSAPSAAITTTESGFTNSTLFETWIQFFANSVPSPIRRPLVLVMDGCSSHYSLPIVQAADNMQVRRVCLPANATHLFQPLDVAVFGSFKAKLSALLNSFAGDSGAVSLSKSMALELAGLAWRTCNFSANVASRFRACGQYPPSLPRITDRLCNFERNGTTEDLKIAELLKVKETVQSNLLVLPVPRNKKSLGRKTATVARELLTQALLKQIEDADRSKTVYKRGSTANRSNQNSKKSRKSSHSAEEKRLQHRAAQVGILEKAVV